MNTSTSVTFTLAANPSVLYTVSVHRDTERRARKTTIYVSGDDRIDEAPLRATATALGLDNIYTQRGDHPVMDAAWDAHNATIVAVKSAHLDLAKGAVPWLNLSGAKFSRKAGCSCGCSPGFSVKSGIPMTVSVDVRRVAP